MKKPPFVFDYSLVNYKVEEALEDWKQSPFYNPEDKLTKL